jgi:NAD(P)-dependent dehydrogenase (short-subunit alcohol dehydrogenase family)
VDLNLKGKVALVTGGGRDIGREISLALGREGAFVAVNYLHAKAEAEAAVADIQRAGGRAAPYPGDITDYGVVTRMVSDVVRDHGRLDILVNNAGFIESRLFLESRPEEWGRQVDVGLYGVLNCCHAAGPRMVEQRGGRIINIVGDSARVGQPRLSITAAARGGVITLARTLARELGRADVTINTLALGYVETSHSDQAWLAANRDKILSSYAIRRLGRPSDVAPFVAFLASEHAGWVTGQTISVSGGYTTVG